MPKNPCQRKPKQKAYIPGGGDFEEPGASDLGNVTSPS